jgi:hypothetical protein
MAKLITFKTPALDKGKITHVEKQGYAAWLYVGPHREKFVLQIGGIDNKPEKLAHYATGQLMPGTLNDMKIRNLMGRGSHARMSDRDAAQQIIHRAVDRSGVDKVISVIRAAPVINKV